MAIAQEPASIFEEELKLFNSKKSDWLQHYKGKYAVIKGTRLLDTFNSEAQAYEAGVDALGDVPFLIKRIEEKEEPIWIPILSLGLRK